jgi:hypothetical protein
MNHRTVVSRLLRLAKRGLLVGLFGLTLSSIVLPASASAHTVSTYQWDAPEDGVGDSPIVP